MELIHNLSIFLTAVAFTLGPLAIIIFVARPSLLHRLTQKNHSRKTIIKRGLISIVVATIILVTIGAFFEPESVKAERLAKQQAESAQKAAAEKLKNDELKPVKKEIISKSTVSYTTIEIEDVALAKGERKTDVQGVDGERTKTYEVTYVQGIEIERRLLSDDITKAAVDKTVLVGTYVAPIQQTTRIVDSAPARSAPSIPSAPASNTYYANCTQARSAGVTPIYVGQPGYRSALDRDKDGIACE